MYSLLDSLEILLCKSVILIDKPGYVWNEMNGASVEECCCLVCIIALLKNKLTWDFKGEIPFSPPKMTIRFSPLFGLRFKKINFSGDFGILMKKIRSGDFSIFDYWFAKIPFSPPNRRQSEFWQFWCSSFRYFVLKIFWKMKNLIMNLNF